MALNRPIPIVLAAAMLILTGCQMMPPNGYGQEQDVLQSHAAGFAVHLMKPVDMDRLVATVAEFGSHEATES